MILTNEDKSIKNRLSDSEDSFTSLDFGRKSNFSYLKINYQCMFIFHWLEFKKLKLTKVKTNEF